MKDKPTVYMLCGLTGSGKTTYAQELEKQGVTRLSLDEEVFALHERDNIAYPDKFLEYEEEAKENLENKLKELLQQGKYVVLDYGFWQKANRERYKQLVTEFGGQWKLVYFKAAPETLMQRLEQRNAREDANALTVTPDMLKDFMVRFEVPVNESESIREAE